MTAPPPSGSMKPAVQEPEAPDDTSDARLISKSEANDALARKEASKEDSALQPPFPQPSFYRRPPNTGPPGPPPPGTDSVDKGKGKGLPEMGPPHPMMPQSMTKGMMPPSMGKGMMPPLTMDMMPPATGMMPPATGKGWGAMPPSMAKGMDMMPPPTGKGWNVSPTDVTLPSMPSMPSTGAGSQMLPPSMTKGPDMSPPATGKGFEQMPPSMGKGIYEMPPPTGKGSQMMPPSMAKGKDIWMPPATGKGWNMMPPSMGKGKDMMPPGNGKGQDIGAMEATIPLDIATMRLDQTMDVMPPSNGKAEWNPMIPSITKGAPGKGSGKSAMMMPLMKGPPLAPFPGKGGFNMGPPMSYGTMYGGPPPGTMYGEQPEPMYPPPGTTYGEQPEPPEQPEPADFQGAPRRKAEHENEADMEKMPIVEKHNNLYQMQQFLAYMFTLLCFVIFAAPTIVCLQLAHDHDVAYWIGRWGNVAWFIPIFLIGQHLYHTWMITKNDKHRRYLFIIVPILPCVLLMVVGGTYMSFSRFLYGQLKAESCTNTDFLSAKYRLQEAYDIAHQYWQQCVSRQQAANGGMPLRRIPTLQTCDEWLTMLKEEPKLLPWKGYKIRSGEIRATTPDDKARWQYLANSELNHVCGGFCEAGPSLWVSYRDTGVQGGACSEYIAFRFLSVMHSATCVFAIALAIFILSFPIYFSSRSYLGKLGYLSDDALF